MEASEKPVSIRDVAARAGVSIATVSRVINDSGHYSQAAGERVRRAIEETGYVVNSAAKSLRETRSRTIGMIVPDISNDFFSNLALHTEQYLAAQGYSVFICNSANSLERESAYIRMLVSKRVDGIISLAGAHDLDPEATTRGIPLVLVDHVPAQESKIPHVVSDDVRGGFLATEHLIGLGCTRILAISRSGGNFDKRRTREVGYLKALAAHGLDSPPEYRISLPTLRPSRFEAEEFVSAAIEEGLPFDGIFAVSDHAAVGALRALKEHGIEVPGQVKVVGYDDSVYSQLVTPQITTIRRFPDQLAQRGCDVLLRLIEGREAPIQTIVPVELVERASTIGG